MINSMTGFARRESSGSWGTLVCELRSVNHRFLEAGFRLPDELRAAGARVTQLVVYRIVAPEKTDPAIAAQILRGDADAVIFASPSAFHNFSKILGGADLLRLSARIQFAAIGPTTARALRESGIRVEIEATEASPAGLADVLVKYFQRSSVAGKAS